MRKSLLLLLLLCTSIFIWGCGQDKATPETNHKLAIGLMPDIDAIPFIIAEKNGYFKNEGLEVELHHFKSAMDRDAALQSNNLDGVVTDMLAVAFAKKGGFDLQMTSATNGNYRLIASHDNTATEVKGMAGKEIAVSKNTIIEYVLDEILASAHLGDNDVKKVVIPQIPTRLAMLEDNKLAGAVLPDPLGPIAVMKGSHEISSSQALNIQPGVLAFSGKIIKENPETLKKFYRAYNRAVEYINNTPQEEYMDYVVEKAGLPPVTAKAEKLPKYKLAQLPKEADWQRVITWLNKKGLVTEEYDYNAVTSNVLP